MDNIKEILKRLQEAKLFINLKKCEWHTQITEYLGFIILLEGLLINLERIRTIRS
jgi:hypothetical protein